MSGGIDTHNKETPCDIDLTKSPPDSRPGSPSVSKMVSLPTSKPALLRSVQRSSGDGSSLPFYLFINDSSEASELAHYVVDMKAEDDKETYVYRRLMQLMKENKSHFPYVTDEEFAGLVGDVPKVKSSKAAKVADQKALYKQKNPPQRRDVCKVYKKMKMGQGKADTGADGDRISESESGDDSKYESNEKDEKDEEDEDEDEEDEKDQDEEDEDEDDDEEEEMTENDQIEAFRDFMESKMKPWNLWPRGAVKMSALQHIKWMVNFSYA